MRDNWRLDDAKKQCAKITTGYSRQRDSSVRCKQTQAGREYLAKLNDSDGRDGPGEASNGLTCRKGSSYTLRMFAIFSRIMKAAMSLTLFCALAGNRVLNGDVPANSAEAQQFFDRLLTPLTPGGVQEVRYKTFIDGLVADGVWQKLDHLSLFFAGDVEGDSLINLISSNCNASRTSDLGFTLHQYYSGGGAYRPITTNFNPATAVSPKFTQNDGMFAIWIASTTQINARALTDGHLSTSGAWTENDNIALFPKWVDGGCFWNVNGTLKTLLTGPADSSGFFLAQRTGANAAALYRNDVLLDSDTSASTPVPNETFYAPCLHSTRAIVIGASLNAAQRTALYNRLTVFITAITGGVP